MKVIFGRYGKIIGAVMLAGVVFPSSIVAADSTSTDNINISVPAACNISGVGQDSHNATILGGTYNSQIGETTMKVTCNDYNGFAVYAIGYTDKKDGKNVLTGQNLNSAFNIPTGTLTSGANSQWAMKLSVTTDPAPTYPVSIQNGFDNFHTVPDSYTLVAKREYGTDLGEIAEGSSFKSTYQVYISQTQPAGTYNGKVKYTLVHPHTEEVFPDDLRGLTLRFDEHVDVDSLSQIITGSPSYNDLHFVLKITAEDIVEHFGLTNSGITTWSQLVAALPSLLASSGATNIQSSMQILDVNQSYAYMKYVGLQPSINIYQDNVKNYVFFHRDGYGMNSEWMFLPASTGSLSYEMNGESYSFNSFRELISSFSGAWLDENYYENEWAEDYFRTISIYSGYDIDDTALAGWLKDNSVTLRILDSVGGKMWTFNEYAPSDNEMQWDISGRVFNEEYISYNFNSISTDNSYGPTIWSFYYNSIDSPYSSGDGFIYLTEDLSVPQYNIDYEAGWYFGNNHDPTSYVKVSPPSIEIVNGEDLYNPALRDWLESNATYVELSQS